jgi:hypothetical protein
MTLRNTVALFLFLALALVTACGDGTTPPVTDAATSDAATAPDGGGLDSGAIDSGTPGTDSGTPDTDSGTPETDAGTPETDAGDVADAGTCPPQPTDLTPTGRPCPTDMCPAGFTCQAYSGIVLQHSCAILCEPGGCPCPATTTCIEVSDKADTWHECG